VACDEPNSAETNDEIDVMLNEPKKKESDPDEVIIEIPKGKKRK